MEAPVDQVVPAVQVVPVRDTLALKEEGTARVQEDTLVPVVMVKGQEATLAWALIRMARAVLARKAREIICPDSRRCLDCLQSAGTGKARAAPLGWAPGSMVRAVTPERAATAKDQEATPEQVAIPEWVPVSMVRAAPVVTPEPAVMAKGQEATLAWALVNMVRAVTPEPAAMPKGLAVTPAWALVRMVRADLAGKTRAITCPASRRSQECRPWQRSSSSCRVCSRCRACNHCPACRVCPESLLFPRWRPL
jgi:hypothetical protein